MRRTFAPACSILLLLFGSVYCRGQMGVPFSKTEPGENLDPVTGKKHSLAFMVNVLQILFSEVPFSVEIFGAGTGSHVFQAGIIFPAPEESFLEQLFESSGKGATASDKGILSYRSSPYNNYGLSLRYEFRKYVNGTYYGPQLMYKNCHYSSSTFPVKLQGQTAWQTESKTSRVGGLGMTIGRQTYFGKQVTDIYCVLGLRARFRLVEVSGIRYPSGSEMILSPPDTENDFKIYPFINLGFRIGFVI